MRYIYGIIERRVQEARVLEAIGKNEVSVRFALLLLQRVKNYIGDKYGRKRQYK